MTTSTPTAYGPVDPRTIERVRMVALACGAVPVAIGVTALIGWAVDSPALRSVFAGDIDIKTNTALCLVMAGVSLMLLTAHPTTPARRQVAKTLALIPIAIGVGTLSEHLFGWDLGIDQLLFREDVGAAATQSPNRMGPPASVCFPLLGLALRRLATTAEGRGSPPSVLPFIVMAAAAIPILGYVFGASQLYGVARYTGVALHTAVALELLAVGILLARPETGATSLLIADQPGGMMLRRVLPAVIVIPTVIGLLRVQGERLGWYDVTFGRTLIILAVTISFTIITWWSAAAVSVQAAGRRRAESAEQELKERLLRIVENVSQGFVSVDRDRRVTYANPVAVTLAARPREEILGRPLAEVFPGDVAAALEHGVHRARESGAVESVETFVSASRTWLDHDIVPTAEGAALFTRDVTESRTREEERRKLLDRERAARSAAEHSNRMKDEFLATLSHELRTPLNAILGWVHLLSEGGLTPEESKRGLDSISRNSHQQVKLIEDLLDMSRIVSGKVSLSLVPVDAVQSLDAAVSAAMPLIGAKELTVERIVPHTAAVVRADSSRLQQVLSNLISNAIKFTPEGGRLRVTVARSETEVWIEVRDSGVGIDPEFLPHVFDRFRQADASSTRSQGGLGLGLAIARELTELHGGSLRASSDGLGKGAAFTVRLPSPDIEPPTPPPSAAAAPAAAAPQMLSRVRVLLVDDHDDAREIVGRVLRERGAEVVDVPAADQAIELLETRPFDVLVSDIAMPGRDGHELIRALRSQQKMLPAIALTAFARPEDRQRALASGYDVHLPKPLDPDRLVSAIANLAIGVTAPNDSENGPYGTG